MTKKTLKSFRQEMRELEEKYGLEIDVKRDCERLLMYIDCDFYSNSIAIEDRAFGHIRLCFYAPESSTPEDIHKLIMSRIGRAITECQRVQEGTPLADDDATQRGPSDAIGDRTDSAMTAPA